MIAGTIRIELKSHGPAPWVADDSTLDLVLASFARRGNLADSEEDDALSVRLVAARRLSWPAPTSTELAVRTNLVQLLDDLQTEFERLAS
jgi:hypothetical protein